LLTAHLDPKRVVVQGGGRQPPLLPNDTPENRARNRRVEIALEIPVDKS
jgi:flagellar motor protein MotB